MTKVLKWLGGGLAAAMLLGFAGLHGAGQADAQGGPPNPPARFVGSVSIDGEAAPAGTVVIATIGGVNCGVATVIASESGATYTVDVDHAGETPGCGGEGDTVVFSVGGYAAAESGTWNNTGLNTLDLSAASGMMEEPGDPDTDEPGEPGEPGEPDDIVVSDTGTGLAVDTGASTPLAAMLVALTLATALGGFAFARRR